MPPRPKPIAQRFWAKIDTSGECWVWTASRDASGYGKIGNGGKHGGWTQAHRLSWEMHHGPIPEGLRVLHRCDNPPCVNPAHLFLGTNVDNVRDMDAKGRGNRPGPRVASRGERRWSAKLTEAQVIEMRERYRVGGVSQEQLAREYGIAQGQVSRILNRQKWAHV